jgi:hypothetical protein
LVLLNWNLHGLNAPVMRNALRDMAWTVHATQSSAYRKRSYAKSMSGWL